VQALRANLSQVKAAPDATAKMQHD
jgi:hypothetical protein